MALIKAGGGVTGISGSIAGTTFARNRAGLYARAWAKPVNPVSPRQSAVRAAFGARATAWGSLTAAQVIAWNDYAATMSRLNRIGEEYTPKGRQVFMEVNQNLANAGETTLTDPGPSTNSPGLNEVIWNAPETTAGVFTDFILSGLTANFPGGANGRIMYEATPPIASNRTNVNNEFRFIGSDPSTLPADLVTRYNSTFGTPTLAPGNQIAVRVWVVDSETGLASPKLMEVLTVTGT